jgi:hypothetical protein
VGTLHRPFQSPYAVGSQICRRAAGKPQYDLLELGVFALPDLKTVLEKLLNICVARPWLPESAPVYAGEFKRLLVRRFDHGIFYRVHGARIVVTALLDLRQDQRRSGGG